MTVWIVRLDRLSDSLLAAGVDWNPWIWNSVIRAASAAGAEEPRRPGTGVGTRKPGAEGTTR